MITIIAVLAALGSYAVLGALDTAKQTRIKLEVDGLDGALKAYKEKYGSYPPCDLRFAGANPNAATIQHVSRLFPRYVMSNTNGAYAKLAADLTAAGVDTANFRPDQALVFWLQGFSPDPANPFITPARRQISTVGTMTTVSPNPMTVSPLYAFDATRLWQVATVAGAPAYISPTSPAAVGPVPSYFPQGCVPPASTAAPYLYWDATTYGTAPVVGGLPAQPNGFNTPTPTPLTAPMGQIVIFPNAGTATPYWSDLNSNGFTNTMADANETWVNPDSFQIIAAGMDGRYGANLVVARLYPTGTNYDPTANLADDDNITNFCTRARLGDAKP